MVHKLKSSSGSIGAKSLQDVAGLLQKALEAGGEEEVLTLKDKLLILLRKLLQELELLHGNSEIDVV